MALLRLAYFFETAWAAVTRAKGVAWLNAFSVGMALVLVATYAMAVINLAGLTAVWGRANSMTCILDDTLNAAAQQRVQAQIAGLPGVRQAHLVTPEAALARFAARSPEAAALVAGVDPSILPPTVDLTLAGDAVDAAAVHTLEAAARAVVGVTGVDFGGSGVEHLRHLVQRLRWGGLAIGSALALGVVVLLSNTIRLTVYARREELAILRLVGATPWFVQAPFLIEGALWGFGGGLLGTVGLWALHRGLAPRLTQALAHLTGGFVLRLFVGPMAAALLLSGLCLGVCGSALALRRFMDPEAG